MNSGTQPSGAIESRKDFEATPSGQYKYWLTELNASDKNLRGFTRQGNRIVERYLAATPLQGFNSGGNAAHEDSVAFKLNLFYANTTTLMSTLYGSVPTVDVSRRYADSSDDVGRVAAEIMERLLNNDMAENSAEIESVLLTNLQDRLTVGLGAARVTYNAQFHQFPDSAEEVMTSENAEVEYVHWRDLRWGWARNFSQVPWIGFRAYLTKDEAVKRFGDKAEKLTYKVQQALTGEDENSTSAQDDNADAWTKAEIWEIWDKRKRQVVWVSKGYDRVLDTKEDPLKLTNFWPCPPFFLANATSTLYIPTADFHLAQDLYNEVDKLQTRISIITDAVKVVGVYDSSNGEIARMLKEGTDNDLIPVENWALFAEKGGIQGQIDWFPINDVVSALTQLITIRDQTIGLLQQVTGMNDLMRGELSNQYEGVGQTQMKAQFGSVRIQALQDQFAQYATDLMQIKAEVISRHCDPQTIAMQANVQHMIDKDLVGPALQLLKQPERARLAVKIRPESIAMVDYAKLKNERTEYINALATFLQSAAPLVEQEPSATPYLLQLLQWGLAGFKGSSEIEGVIDKAVEAAQEAAKKAQEQPEQPSPEQQMQQAEQQFAMQLEQFKAQAELKKIESKAMADVAVREADKKADLQQLLAESQSQLKQVQADMIASLTETKAKMTADIQKEIAQAQANVMQTEASATAEIGKDVASAQIEMGKDTASTQLEIQKEAAKTGMKIDEIEAGAKARIKEQGTTKSEASDDG